MLLAQGLQSGNKLSKLSVFYDMCHVVGYG